ncbi:hypothetical protein ACPOL_6489 [Acidisarcina polymorpha]|uniref:Uncharacterized protein n=1 Tax=Acidisarcina polymorpha TaxID=2211140 RepID=A0A2Z5GAS3_9BACT|nr:hypothetical protein ACPOL_6489 [Acidisarcina polymorpha]
MLLLQRKRSVVEVPFYTGRLAVVAKKKALKHYVFLAM